MEDDRTKEDYLKFVSMSKENLTKLSTLLDDDFTALKEIINLKIENTP